MYRFWVLSFLISTIALAVPLPQACFAPSETSCSFYSDCVENVLPCGTSGYALSYGEHYCSVFENIVPKLTEKGKVWIHSTRACLQSQLSQEIIARWDVGTLNNLNCNSVRTFAFNSHPFCYTQRDTSICDLDRRKDLPRILRVLKGQYFRNPNDFAQVERVIGICLRNISKKKNPEKHDFWMQQALELYDN
jgi:hypothetical protein